MADRARESVIVWAGKEAEIPRYYDLTHKKAEPQKRQTLDEVMDGFRAHHAQLS